MNDNNRPRPRLTQLFSSSRAPYEPNRIPLIKRIWYIVVSIALLWWGGNGVYHDDLLLAGNRGGKIHLHGEAAWMMCGAMICWVLALLSVIVDHYDTRDNEIGYENFVFISSWAGIGLMVVAVVYGSFTLGTYE
jgi:hypothetical protein